MRPSIIIFLVEHHVWRDCQFLRDVTWDSQNFWDIFDSSMKFLFLVTDFWRVFFEVGLDCFGWTEDGVI